MKKKSLMKKIAVPMAVLMAIAVAPVQAFGTDVEPEEAIANEAKAAVEEVAQEVVEENLPEENVEATEPEAVEKEVATGETKGEVKLAAAADLKAAASNATAPAAKETVPYTGNAQQLVTFTNDNTPERGAVQYRARVGSTGDRQTDPSKVTGTDAGTYTVNIQKREAYNDHGWKWGNNWKDAGSINVTIAKAKISATITAKEKVYDGTTDATVAAIHEDRDPMYIDGVNGEKVHIVTKGYKDVSGSFADKNVGENKAVTVAVDAFALEDSGRYDGKASNYELSTVTCTGTITQRPVAVSGIKGVDKTYDGTTDAELDFSEVSFGTVGGFPDTGIVTGDNLTATATGTFNNPNAGIDKEIAISNLALSGTDAGNYRITNAEWVVQKTANADIEERTVSFNIADAAKVEGETDPQLSLTFGNVLDEDQPAFAERFTVEREAGEAVGTYKIKVKDNYMKPQALMTQGEGEGIFDNYNYSAFETAEATFTITAAVVPVDDDDTDVDKDDDAKTGDNSPLLPIAGLALLAMAGAAAAFCRRKSDSE